MRLLATLGALIVALPAAAISPAEAQQRGLGFAAKGGEAPPSTLNVRIECGAGKSREGLAETEFTKGKAYELSEPNVDGLSSVVYLGLPQFAIKIPRMAAWASLADEALNAPPASGNNEFALKFIPRTFECQLTCATADEGCSNKLGPDPVPILVKDKVDGYTLTDIILTLAVDGKPAPSDVEQCKSIGATADFSGEKYDAIKALQGDDGGGVRTLTRIFRSLTGTDRRSQMQAKIETMLKCMLGEVGEAARGDDGIFYHDVKPDNVMFGKWGGGEDRLALIDYMPEKATKSFEDFYLPIFCTEVSFFNCPKKPCPCKYWGEFIGEADEFKIETLKQWGALCTNDVQFASSGTSHLRLNARDAHDAQFASSGTSHLRLNAAGDDAVPIALEQINRVLTKELDILDRESRT